LRYFPWLKLWVSQLVLAREIAITGNLMNLNSKKFINKNFKTREKISFSKSKERFLKW
jgi:hypothetical protein